MGTSRLPSQRAWRENSSPPPGAGGLEGDPPPNELLLDEEPRGAADPLVENLLPIREGRRLRREVVPPHPDSLAPGEADGLDHELEVRVVHELLKGAESVERPIGGQPRDPEVPHEVPRERLVRLEPRGGAGWPHGRGPRRLERVRAPVAPGRLPPHHRPLRPPVLP